MAIHLDLEAELPADLLTIDALALDLDGTLARNDKHVSDATIAALARLHATGVAIIVATGRVYPATVGIYERANIDGPLIAASGAMAVASVRDYAHGVAGAASYEPMDDALYARILDFCRKHNLQLVIFGRDHLFAKEDGEAVRVLAERNEGEQPIVADLEELPREDRLKAALFASDAEYERIRADLAAEFPNAARSYDGTIEVTSPATDKWVALRTILEGLGVPVARTAGIGDSANDLPWLREVGVAICPSNSVAAVKDISAYEIGSNDEDAVAALCNRIAEAREAHS